MRDIKTDRIRPIYTGLTLYRPRPVHYSGCIHTAPVQYNLVGSIVLMVFHNYFIRIINILIPRANENDANSFVFGEND